jgi:hypothetical protein
MLPATSETDASPAVVNTSPVMISFKVAMPAPR